MSPAVGYALLSLLFAGCIDITYKLYSKQARSRGMFVCGMGVTWLIIQLGLFLIAGKSPVFNEATVLWGLLAGIVLTASNILLVECLTHMDVSVGSTIYRLNTIGVVILSFLILSEPLGVFKISGILFGIIAVLLLYQRGTDQIPTFPLIFLLLAIAASVFRALYGVLSKIGLKSGGDMDSMSLIFPLCWIIGGFLYAALREKRVRMTFDKAKYCASGGVLAFLIVYTLMSAIEIGDVSILIPIANLGFVIALSYSIVTGMEKFSARKGFAITCAGLSIFLLAQAGT